MGRCVVPNFAKSTIATVGGISAGATSLAVQAGHGALFSPSGIITTASGNWSYAVLVDTSGNREIVKYTNVTGDTLTIVRAQGSTTARAFAQNDVIQVRPVGEIHDDFADRAPKIENASAGDFIRVDGSANSYSYLDASEMRSAIGVPTPAYQLIAQNSLSGVTYTDFNISAGVRYTIKFNCSVSSYATLLLGVRAIISSGPVTSNYYHSTGILAYAAVYYTHNMQYDRAVIHSMESSLQISNIMGEIDLSTLVGSSNNMAGYAKVVNTLNDTSGPALYSSSFVYRGLSTITGVRIFTSSPTLTGTANLYAFAEI